jgi:hypothetical protein
VRSREVFLNKHHLRTAEAVEEHLSITLAYPCGSREPSVFFSHRNPLQKIKSNDYQCKNPRKKKRSMKPPKNNNNSPAIDQIQGESMKLLK